MRKIIFPFCKLSKCFFPWFPWHCRNQFFRTEGAEDSHRAALSTLCALMGCHGNLPPFSSRWPHILLRTLFRCSTNNLWFYLPFIWGFHNMESWSFVISTHTGTSVPTAFAHVTFVSVLSLWAQTWSPMTTSFASLWIFFFFWLKILVSVFWSKQNHFRLKSNH